MVMQVNTVGVTVKCDSTKVWEEVDYVDASENIIITKDLLM